MTHAEHPVIAITEAGALGRAVTAHLVARNWRVAIYHLPWMQAHAGSIRDAHGPQNVRAHMIDPADWRSLARAAEATRQEFGRAPAAALIALEDFHTDGPMHHGAGDGDTYSRSATLNVDAVYRMLHVLLPPMVAARHGSIVVMGSRLAQRPWEGAGAAAFTAAKAATTALVQAVAQEVLEHGVRVNTILEGIVDEPGARASVPHAEHSRWVPMQSLVAAIGFLLSDDARNISGAAIPLYGRS